MNTISRFRTEPGVCPVCSLPSTCTISGEVAFWPMKAYPKARIINMEKMLDGELATCELDFRHLACKRKPVLHLNLKKKWFDMIGNPKVEEYREMSEYWRRFFKWFHTDHEFIWVFRIKGKTYMPSQVRVCFSNGYRKDRKQKFFDVENLHIGCGRPEWGAVEGKEYFIITIKPEES